MKWENELDKISIRPEGSMISTYGTLEEDCPRYIKYSDAETLITSLLKRQREICADAFFSKDKTGGSYHRRIKHNIRNAPEPE